MSNPEYKPGDAIWRASNPNGREGTTVRYKPFNSTTHDRKDGKKFRGAQVWSIDRANMTLRVQLEPSVVGTR